MFFILIVLISLFVKTFANCPSDTDVEWNSNCYSFYSSNSTGFADAELLCKQKGGHLASIHDGFLNALLSQEGVKRFHNSSATDFWVGASNLMKPPTWNWTDGSTFDFTDWKKGEPQNATGVNCVAISLSDGLWSATDCFVSKPFACSSPSIATPTSTPYPDYINCTEGFIYFKSTHSCYGNSNTNNVLSWQDAQLHCEGLGGNLPSIHSYEEENFIKLDLNKHFEWSDGTPVNYLDWINNRPFKNHSSCVVLGIDGFRDDFVCSTGLRALCKISMFT